MRRLILRCVICAALLSHAGCLAHRQGEFFVPSDEWQSYSTPEEAGFESKKLEEAMAFADSIGSAAVFVVYRGAVLVDWGETSRRFKCHSMRKSLLSALCGIYIDNGTIDVNRTLGEMGIDDFPNPLTEQEKSARIVDLLSARSGIYLPAASEPARNIKPPRGSHPPGTHWCYNNWDFNTLLTIFEQETGKKIFREFDRQFAEPLHMEHFDPSHGFYHYERDKSMHPAYPFRMSARDLARFGLLFLNKGRWGDRPILSEEYVKLSTSLVSLDPSYHTGSGYGYMWWINQAEPFKAMGMFSALGTGEHSIDILPGADMVLVHRPNTYLWKRITYQQRRKLIQLVLDARVDEPHQNPDLVPISRPWPSFESLPLTEDDKNSCAGAYLNDGGKFPFVIENIDGQLRADFGEGKVNMFKVGKDHFVIEDYDDHVYFITDEEGNRELISINTLIMDGDSFLESGDLDRAFAFYKKAETYYGDDPRVITCLEDVKRLREKK